MTKLPGENVVKSWRLHPRKAESKNRVSNQWMRAALCLSLTMLWKLWMVGEREFF